jgi:hypothetical protein
MQEVRKALAPLTDWMPPEVRDHLDVEVWWLVFLVTALLALLIAGHLLRAFRRALFRRRRPNIDFDRPLRLELDECPVPAAPPGERQLLAYHLPVRLRVVVVAPGGKDIDVDAEAIESLLQRLLPGLGAVAANDQPLIRIWPPQLSHQGFFNLFHRCMIKPERNDEPSRWILVAGRAVIARAPLFLGLAMSAGETNTFGPINLEAHQWLDVLRVRTAEK